MASTLMEPEFVEKIIEIDSHLAGAMSGFVADARTMIDFARVEAQVCCKLSLVVGFIVFK